MPNNTCPQCKTSDITGWIHDHVTDRFICSPCSYRNFERTHAVAHQDAYQNRNKHAGLRPGSPWSGDVR